MLSLKRVSMLGVGLCALAAFNFLPPPTPPSPTVSTVTPLASSPGRVYTYTAQDLDAACEDIIAFDGRGAYANAPKDQPILWSLAVNFRLQSPADTPVACFKLYHSNGVDQYELLDRYLIDTCSVTNARQLVRSSPRQVTFLGGGYIACAVNLADWVATVAGRQTDPNLHFLLERFYWDKTGRRSFHEYANLTLLARGVTPVDDPGVAVLPILSYTHPPDVLVSEPTLALNADPAGIFLGRCLLNFSQSYYWWYDLRAGSRQHFTYSQAVPARTYPDCGEGQDTSPLTFWIEDATLLIGSNGSDTFQGTLEGVLIDPTDSKPPEGGSIILAPPGTLRGGPGLVHPGYE